MPLLNRLTRMLMLALAFAAPLGGLAAAGPPSTNVAWLSAAADADIDRAFAQARAEDKPVLLYWGATWCPPCNQLKATLFNRQDFADASRAFVAVHVDGDRPGAQKLGARFKVSGYPTVVLFSRGRQPRSRACPARPSPTGDGRAAAGHGRRASGRRRAGRRPRGQGARRPASGACWPSIPGTPTTAAGRPAPSCRPCWPSWRCRPAQRRPTPTRRPGCGSRRWRPATTARASSPTRRCASGSGACWPTRQRRARTWTC